MVAFTLAIAPATAGTFPVKIVNGGCSVKTKEQPPAFVPTE